MMLEKFLTKNIDVVFGETNEFACQIKLDDNMHGEWLVGKVCFWVSGEMIGDYEYSISLRDTMFAMRQVVEEQGRRQHDYFLGTSTSEFYNRVYNCMFGNLPDCDDIQQMQEEEWGRLLVDIPISAISNPIIYFIEGEINDRIIIIGDNLSECKDVYVKSGVFYDIISQAYTYLNEIYLCQ